MNYGPFLANIEQDAEQYDQSKDVSYLKNDNIILSIQANLLEYTSTIDDMKLTERNYISLLGNIVNKRHAESVSYGSARYLFYREVGALLVEKKNTIIAT